MSNTSEILKTLSDLEQNLNDINSAKKQVEKVVKSSEDLTKTFEAYKSSFDGLSSNVQSILKDTKIFNLETLSKLSKQTDNLQTEIIRLTEFDFTETFQAISNDAVKVFENKLSKKLALIDEKVQEIQTKIDAFNAQINRLKSINLEKCFVELQNALSDISNTINSIKQGIDSILQLLNKNQTETVAQLISFQAKISQQIAAFENETQEKFNLVQKEIKTNRFILVFGIILIIASIVGTYLLLPIL